MSEIERAPSIAAGGEQQHFPDPGLPAHVYRQTDVDPKAAKKAERQVAGLFLLSALGAIVFVAAYFAIPLRGDLRQIGLSRTLTGLGLAVSLFCIGAGAVHWAKKLMPDDEVTEERHPIRSSEEDRVAATAVLRDGGEAAGFPRRKLIWGSLTAALGAAALPALVPLWDLWYRNKGSSPAEQISSTKWGQGTRLLTDPTGRPIKASDVPLGGVVHVLPEVQGARSEVEAGDHDGLSLEDIAKSAVLLIRLRPEDLREREDRKGWSYNGLVAYSKICTHVGCPVGLYEQTTHHLLCPCHQSTFDVPDHCKVVFGPAARPLPQLALSVDPEGYLVSQHDFTEPVGPSFWERG